MEKAKSALDNFRDDIINVVRKFSERYNYGYTEAAKLAIDALVDSLMLFAQGKPSKFLKKRDNTSREEDETSSLEQLEHLHESVKKTTDTAGKVLRSFIQSSKKEFENLLLEMETKRDFSTTNKDEVRILRHHCFIASEVSRFPYRVKTASEENDVAGRILKAAVNPPKPLLRLKKLPSKV